MAAPRARTEGVAAYNIITCGWSKFKLSRYLKRALKIHIQHQLPQKLFLARMFAFAKISFL